MPNEEYGEDDEGPVRYDGEATCGICCGERKLVADTVLILDRGSPEVGYGIALEHDYEEIRRGKDCGSKHQEPNDPDMHPRGGKAEEEDPQSDFERAAR